MYCLNCGLVLPDDANFCFKCATPTVNYFETQTVHAPRRVVPFSELEKPKAIIAKNNFQSAMGAILLFLLIGGASVGGIFLWAQYETEQKKQSNPNTAAEITKNDQFAGMRNEASAPVQISKPRVRKIIQPQPEADDENTNETSPVPQSRLVVNDTFALNAGGYRYYKFDLENTSQVVGRVEASGGSNDIDTIVMDADEFTNFQNRGAYRSYYHSGYTTIGKIDLNLSAGSYYVVFSNTNALLTNKVVKAKVEIQ